MKLFKNVSQFTCVLVFFAVQFSYGQLEITEGVDANILIDELLGDNEGIVVTNISIKGSQSAYGIFKSNLKYNSFFNKGIILTNGLASNAIGPNDSPQKSAKIDFSNDADINKITGYKGCYDTLLFEFDLVSATDEIQFRYFFASEEYPEYVNRNVNDAFIFLVTNLTTSTSENIAILNGDNMMPITIDHINHKVNSNYYVDNLSWNKTTIETNRDNPKQLELPYMFQYDGFTKVLVAKAKVIPNTKYHLKLGISDVGDQLYDSAIFLESNSLKSTGKKDLLEDTLGTFKDVVSLDFNIAFQIDSATIVGDRSFNLMDKIIKQLQNKPNLHIKIIGHTDSIGTTAYNYQLSLDRALSVKKYFTNNGILPSKIEVYGKGETQPKSSVLSENRRVEIVFVKK